MDKLNAMVARSQDIGALQLALARVCPALTAVDPFGVRGGIVKSARYGVGACGAAITLASAARVVSAV